MAEAQVRLRPIAEADLPDYVRWLNDPEVTQFTQIESGGVTLEGEREWLAHISAPDRRERHWAIEAGGRHIGNCALMPDESGEMAGFGMIIGDKTQWSKGYGTAALREVLRIGFAEMCLQRVHLTALAANARGIRCYEKCGFRPEGVRRRHFLKRGKWEDLVCMGILREEWEEQQTTSACGDEVMIRAYRSADHPAVVALLEATGFAPLGRNDEKERIAWKLATQPGFFLVAEAEGSIVGTVVGSLERGWGWIQRLAVHPDHRRRGLATRLMHEAENAHAALGAYRACLLTHEENRAARGLYGRLGYEIWDKVIVMSRELDE